MNIYGKCADQPDPPPLTLNVFGELETSTTETTQVHTGVNPTPWLPFLEQEPGEFNLMTLNTPPAPSPSSITFEKDGFYHFTVDFGFKIQAGGSSRDFEIVSFVDNVLTGVPGSFTLAGNNDTTLISFTGIVFVPQSLTYDIRIRKVNGADATIDLLRVNTTLYNVQ